MTDPQELAQDQVYKHWAKFGKALNHCIYTKTADSDYDEETGEESSKVIAKRPIRVIFDEFSMSSSYSSLAQSKQIEIQYNDKIALFPYLDLTLEPTINDTVTDPDGKIWTVKGIGTDPLKAHYQLHIRPQK